MLNQTVIMETLPVEMEPEVRELVLKAGLEGRVRMQLIMLRVQLEQEHNRAMEVLMEMVEGEEKLMVVQIMVAEAEVVVIDRQVVILQLLEQVVSIMDREEVQLVLQT